MGLPNGRRIEGGGLPNGRRIEGGGSPEWSWKTPLIHSDLWITPKTAPRSTLSRSAVWLGRKRCPGPPFVAPGRVNGPSCGTGGISGTTDWRCPVARAGRRARTASAGGPRRNFPGLSRPFGCGFSALPWNVVSPPSETPRLAFGSLLGDPWGYSTRRCGPVVGAIAGFEGKRIKTPLAVE